DRFARTQTPTSSSFRPNPPRVPNPLVCRRAMLLFSKRRRNGLHRRTALLPNRLMRWVMPHHQAPRCTPTSTTRSGGEEDAIHRRRGGRRRHVRARAPPGTWHAREARRLLGSIHRRIADNPAAEQEECFHGFKYMRVDAGRSTCFHHLPVSLESWAPSCDALQGCQPCCCRVQCRHLCAHLPLGWSLHRDKFLK
uniref:Uncharacterized protein n=6 Tax=Aegilops tauschii subsp. strangulata TaxID=200361 RepID=A0A453EHC2_AEGTS